MVDVARQIDGGAERQAAWGRSRQGIWTAFQAGRLSADAATCWLLVLGLAERRRGYRMLPPRGMAPQSL